MVGHAPLEGGIMVRVHVPQQIILKALSMARVLLKYPNIFIRIALIGKIQLNLKSI